MQAGSESCGHVRNLLNLCIIHQFPELLLYAFCCVSAIALLLIATALHMPSYAYCIATDTAV